MLHNLWVTLLYKPLVNLLAYIIYIIPGGDLGLAVILLTILVKVILFPLASKSIESQVKMNLIQPELDKIKNSGKSKEEQAKLTFEIYKKYKTNPFSGCLLIFIQIPIIFALYYSFRGIHFDNGILYSFTPTPTSISNMFLGFINMDGKNLTLAFLAGVSQFLQAHFMPKPKNNPTNKGTFNESFQKSLQMQMKYVFPVLVTVIAYSISGAIALYWITSNVFTTLQQVYLMKKKNTLVNQ